MSFINSYLSVLNEDTKKNSSVAVDNTGELDGAEKAKKFVKDSGPESVKNTETPVKGPHSEQDPDALPKAVNSESKNPFDLLYNKVLAQEAFGEEEGDTLDFGGTSENDLGEILPPQDEDGEEDFGLDTEEGEEEEGEEEEVEGLEAVLDHLKSAVEALETFLSDEEGEDEEGDDEAEDLGELEDEMEDDMEDDMEEDEDEIPVSQESVDAEIEGHALVNKDRLEKGLTNKAKQNVRGAVPVKKKKGLVTKGQKVDGKPQTLGGNPTDLTNRAKQNVGGVKVGKGLFDQ